MRSRPKIELFIAHVIHPGDIVDARVVLHEATETPVDAVTVKLVAKERSQYGKAIEVRELFILEAVVARDTKLQPGDHAYEVRFKIPKDAPIGYPGTLTWISYAVHVHVDIPFWPDAKDTFPIVVEQRQRPRAAPKPAVQTTASGTAPFLELSLDDTALAPGDVLSGAIAAGHLEGSSARRIRLSLLAFERTRINGYEYKYTRTFAVFSLPPGGVARGVPVPFKLIVPYETTPGFERETAALAWWLEARVERALRSDLTTLVPLEIAVFAGAKERPRVGARPLLGADRWRVRWAGEGARHGLALDPDELLLRGEIGGVGVELGVAPDGDHFAIELRFPAFGVGLDVGARRVFGGIDVDDAAPMFARRFHVGAREAAQARAVLSVDLRRYLTAFSEARLEDASAHLSLPGEDRDEIRAAVDLVHALAGAIARARERVPPPAAMTAALPAWRRFAEANHGALSIGDMRVEGTIGGGRFEIATVLDGPKPTSTRILARIDPPIPHAVDLGDPSSFGARARDAAPLAQELAKLGALSVDETTVTLTLAGALADPEEHAGTLASLFRLGSLLRGDVRAGPYR